MPAGPGIDFATAFPEPATYRLFLDFQHRGQVHTAAFTVESGGAPAGGAREATMTTESSAEPGT